MLLECPNQLSRYLCPYEQYTSLIPLVSNTNTAASQIVDVITLILFEVFFLFAISDTQITVKGK
jgi:hypothetical protein